HQGTLEEDAAFAFSRGLGVVRQQALDLGAKRRVAGAGAVEEGRALAGGQAGRAVEQGPYPFAPLGSHEPPSSPPSRRDSHARARRQSRLTVLADSPSTVAVSSTLRPLK